MSLYLETHRLILRPFEERDTFTFSKYRSDPEVAKYQGWETPYSIEQARKFVVEMKSLTPGEPGCWYQLAIELKSSGMMIGDCAFRRFAKDHAQAEIGFTIAQAYQHQGYGYEAVSHLLEYLFSELKLHRVQADCDPENIASGRLLQKLGMRYEGRFIESLWLKGEWVSEDWYAILEREWNTRWSKPEK